MAVNQNRRSAWNGKMPERETTNRPFIFFIVQKHITYKLFNNMFPAKAIYYVQNCIIRTNIMYKIL